MRTPAELLEEARQLPLHMQQWLGHELLDRDQSESPEEVEAAWEIEIKHRVDELDAGSVQTIPAEEVLAEMEAMIAAHRRG